MIMIINYAEYFNSKILSNIESWEIFLLNFKLNIYQNSEENDLMVG
jgi:hypothetical protein